MLFKIKIEDILSNGGYKKNFKFPFDCKKIKRIGFIVDTPNVTVLPDKIGSYISIILNNGDDFVFSDLPVKLFEAAGAPVPEDYPMFDFNEFGNNAVECNIPVVVNANNIIVLKNTDDGDTLDANQFDITIYFDYDK